MDFTAENLLEYFNRVYQLKKQHDFLRLGQCHINVFHEMFPDFDHSLYIGTDCDCFYNDEKIDKFIEFLSNNLKE